MCIGRSCKKLDTCNNRYTADKHQCMVSHTALQHIRKTNGYDRTQTIPGI